MIFFTIALALITITKEKKQFRLNEYLCEQIGEEVVGNPEKFDYVILPVIAKQESKIVVHNKYTNEVINLPLKGEKWADF